MDEFFFCFCACVCVCVCYLSMVDFCPSLSFSLENGCGKNKSNGTDVWSEQMSFDEFVFSNKCVGFNFIMRCMRIKYRENFHSMNDNNDTHLRDLTKNYDFVWFTCHNFRYVLDFAAWWHCMRIIFHFSVMGSLYQKSMVNFWCFCCFSLSVVVIAVIAIGCCWSN